MTNKEALEKIITLVAEQKENTYDKFMECKNQLENDFKLLERYKALEEKLGIDLITLFEEMEKPRETHYENIYLKYKGQIWVLRKEELEK